MSDTTTASRVFLAELTHTHITVDAKNTPLAIGYVGSYLKQELGPHVDIELFKYPTDLSTALGERMPKLVAFSNYMWNEELGFAFARRIKAVNPSVVTVIGGPNYPTDAAEQNAYMADHPEVDFFVDGEGEIVFRDLVLALEAGGFDARQLRSGALAIPGVHYRHENRGYTNGPARRIANIDTVLPSPYLSGILDKFFDKNLTPLLQTSRGCPYSCTFCHDGSRYANKTYRYSNERIHRELLYAAQHTQVPSLTLADLNWGIFPEDLEVAVLIKEIQNQYGWPQNIQTATAKNQKERIVEMSRILGGAMIVGASIQSNDDEVLANIKRKNIGYETIVKMAKEASKTDASTFTEIILALPGDTVAKHMQAVFDMLDAGIQDINLYQYILLRGTEGANNESRRRFAYQTAFRVIPRCFGIYDILGEPVRVSEIHEVVIGNSTMPHEDYLACRDFDLSLMIFNNGRILDEFFYSAAHLGLKRGEIIRDAHERAVAPGSGLHDIYKSYREDEQSNFRPTKEALSKFVLQEGGLELYLAGKRGQNQLHFWKSVAIFDRLSAVTECLTECIKDLLRQRDRTSAVIDSYFGDLRQLVHLKKGLPTELDVEYRFSSAFDFLELEKTGYMVNPFDGGLQRNATTLLLRHSPERRQIISAYLDQYGSDMKGLAHLTHRFPAKILFRAVDRC